MIDMTSDAVLQAQNQLGKMLLDRQAKETLKAINARIETNFEEIWGALVECRPNLVADRKLKSTLRKALKFK